MELDIETRQISIGELRKTAKLLREMARVTARWNTPIEALGVINKLIKELDPHGVCPLCNDETVIDVTDGGATPCPLCAYLNPPDLLDELPF